MKLYWGPHTCAIGTHLLLEEIGRQYETEKVDVEAGALKEPWFKAINPKSKVPTLVLDNGRVLTEFGAIAVWLARQAPEQGLIPTDPDEEQRALSLLDYPNYSLGQTQDMMNDIYPKWVEAHGVMIVTPVNWYSPTSPLKLMMDRLVCADGGNPDPSLTHGKEAKDAKREELKGWSYPRHLKGRLFSVVVHGDVEGAENVRRGLSDWMRFMHMESAGTEAELDRYIGYWKPYATSHDELDRDTAIQEEVRNAARTLCEALRMQRAGRLHQSGQSLEAPRPK